MKRLQSGDREWGPLCSGKLEGQAFRELDPFRRLYEPKFLHLLMPKKKKKKTIKITKGDICFLWLSAVQFSRSVVSNSLQPHGLQHARLPCALPTPRVFSNSRPLSRWCHPTISSSIIPFSSCPQSFRASGVFSSESVLHIRWPKYWSFSFNISPSNEHPGLISFRMDCLQPSAKMHTSLLVYPSLKPQVYRGP